MIAPETTNVASDPAEIMPGVSVEALLALREAAIGMYGTLAKDSASLSTRLKEFGVRLPRLSMHRGDGRETAVLDDRHYHGAMRQEVDREIWKRLFELTNVAAVMSSEARNKASKALHEGDVPEVTADNVYSTLRGIREQQPQYFADAVEAVFKALSWDHKTNQPDALTGRFILQYGVDVWSRGDSRAALGYDSRLFDLEKVLCLIDKRNPPSNDVGLRSIYRSVPWGEWTAVPSTQGGKESLFEIKCHKVGTVHVRIADSKLVDAMNKIMGERYPMRIAESRDARTKRGSRGRHRNWMD